MAGLALLLGCEVAADEALSCEEQEETGYPEMEVVAEQAIGDVAEVYPVSGCESDDDGVPDARYAAQIESWHRIRQARDHLASSGWVVDDARQMTSADGAYLAKLDTMLIAGSGKAPHVVITFRRAD